MPEKENSIKSIGLSRLNVPLYSKSCFRLRRDGAILALAYSKRGNYVLLRRDGLSLLSPP
jgi:hypothetical protein